MRIWRLTAPFWNIVKRSRVQWMRKVIAKSDFEHAAQVYCRRRADSTEFEKCSVDTKMSVKPFGGTEPIVCCFKNVLVDTEPTVRCFRSAL